MKVNNNSTPINQAVPRPIDAPVAAQNISVRVARLGAPVFAPNQSVGLLQNDPLLLEPNAFIGAANAPRQPGELSIINLALMQAVIEANPQLIRVNPFASIPLGVPNGANAHPPVESNLDNHR